MSIDDVDFDPGLGILVLGFLCVVGAGLYAVRSDQAVRDKTPMSDEAAYKAAVIDAAVRKPHHVVPLKTIDAGVSHVNLVNLNHRMPQTDKRTYSVWGVLPEDLRLACKGAADPVKRLLQVLGLPPREVDDLRVITLRVPREGLFRPCFHPTALTETTCSADGSPSRSVDPAASVTNERQAQLAHAEFIADQIWKSGRWGFSAGSGFPFTGFGWTYDWGKTPGTVGVTEFVVRREVGIEVLDSVTPKAFCNS